jgi:hypothetical protein
MKVSTEIGSSTWHPAVRYMRFITDQGEVLNAIEVDTSKCEILQRVHICPLREGCNATCVRIKYKFIKVKISEDCPAALKEDFLEREIEREENKLRSIKCKRKINGKMRVGNSNF